MHKKTEITRSLMLAFGGSVWLGSFVAPAQAQRVEITGSSIRQISSETALPVTVLKTEDLARAGVTNAEQALAFITSNQSSVTAAASIGDSIGGVAYADLRGLGAGRTLVLVNGKRMVNNPYYGGVDVASAVDLNTIPYGAVERIEVLNDGASSIYGADAVAGVVNFITRREFQGLTLEGSLTQPTQSGGGQGYQVGATGGIGSLTEQGWNLFGSVNFRGQASLRATDRSFSKSAYIPGKGIDYTSVVSSPANYYQDPLPDLFNPSLPDCDPPTSFPSFGYCGFDYVRYTDTVPQQYQLSLLAKGSYAVDTNNTVSLEYLQGNNKLTTRVAPTALAEVPMPSTNPFFPGGPGAGGVPGTAANPDPGFDPNSPIGLYWRTTQMGSRTDTFDTKTDRFLLDWQGTHKGWDYTVAALGANADSKHYFDGGYLRASGMDAGLSGTPAQPGDPVPPWLNPFGAQTPEGLAYMRNQLILGQAQRAEGRLWGVKADASGEIYKLPAGPLTMALGLEYYRDKVEYTNNFALTREAASSGLENSVDAFGSRSWTGVFVEFNAPVVKELEVNLALRYDHYSDFGSTVNPKAAFRWTPAKELMVRGSINTGFRAPSLFEVYSPPSTTNTGNFYNDPVLCPDGNLAPDGNQARDCRTQFNLQSSGNRNLDAETSTAWSFGLVFQPTPSSTVSVDYWNYTIKDSIGTFGEEVLFSDPTKYAANFVRCSQLTPAQAATIDRCNNPGNADPLAYLDDPYRNLGHYKTSGLDFTAAWRSVATEYGRFSIAWQATYVLEYEYQLESGGAYNNNLGTYFNGKPISRYRQVLNLGWQQGAWLVNLVNRYTRGYNDQNDPEWVAPEYFNRVDAVNTWDLAATWSGIKNLSVTAGLMNMFNQDPPFSNTIASTQVGFDYRHGNPIGRAFLLRAVYTF